MSKKFNHSFVDLPKLKQITTDEGRRYETENGTRAPSITTVLGDTADKSGLFEWRKRVGEEKANAISRNAAARGTKMHTLCEKYLLNEDMGEITNDMGGILFKGIRPLLDKLDNVRCLESRLFSSKLGVAGTVDCIAEFDGNLTVIDFKTSRRPKKKEHIEDYFLQGCFYFSAFYEMTGELPNQISILIAVEDGSIIEHTIQQRELVEYTEKLKKRIRHWYYKKGMQPPEGAQACY